MKKIVLITMIFLCALVKAQVIVDPETFPIVTGTISDKNLYTNTGGEGKISVKSIIDSVQILDTTSITYADFYTAITNSQLQVGRTYILIDFQTIYDQMDFDNTGALKGTLTTKTGAVEQIWVLALSPNQIADKAYSATYPKDEIQYDWTYNTTLINGSPAKGRISERIDEWNNRTDYDHREIKFIRYDDGAGNFTIINDNGNASAEFLTFGNNYGAGGIIYDNWLGDFYSIGQFFGQEYSNNVFNGGLIVSNKTGSLFYNNTFINNVFLSSFFGNISNSIFLNNIESSTLSGVVLFSIFNHINTSTINGYMSNVILNGSISFSTFSGEIQSSSINDDILYSTFSGYLNNVIFNNGTVRKSTFNGSLSNITFNSSIDNSELIGSFINSIFSQISYSNINGIIDACTIEDLPYCNINGSIIGKTINNTLYPFLPTNYEKRIFGASDGNVYARYFDGTNDINVLIP